MHLAPQSLRVETDNSTCSSAFRPFSSGIKKWIRRICLGRGHLERLVLEKQSSPEDVTSAILSSKKLSEELKADWLAMQRKPASDAEARMATDDESLRTESINSIPAAKDRFLCCPLGCVGDGDSALSEETNCLEVSSGKAECNAEDALRLHQCHTFKRTMDELRKKKRIANAASLESGRLF